MGEILFLLGGNSLTTISKTDLHPLIRAFINVGPYIQTLVNEDITIGIYD